MTNPISAKKIAKIRDLRSRGVSYAACARILKIDPTTAKKYESDIAVKKREAIVARSHAVQEEKRQKARLERNS